MYKYSFLGFSWDFDHNQNNLSKYFHDFELTFHSNDTNILFIGSFINEEQYNYICSLNCIKILYITEPIEFTVPFSYKLYHEKKCDYFTGCISNDYNNNCFMYPFYIDYRKHENILFMDMVNENVKKCDLDTLNNKRFAALVNRHDNGGTRIPMYNKLKDLGYIECPSHLLNNCSSKELDELLNIDYYKLFKFIICPENYLTTIPGYMTEKLWIPCLAGAIPIYHGYFSENEEKIFNTKRILFYDPRDEESIEKVRQKVDFLLKNPEEFVKFYRQPVFCDTAFEAIKQYDLNMYYMMKSVYQKLEANK